MSRAALTVHKSQGMTVQKAWAKLGKKEFASSITYVIFSRVTSFEGLTFAPFPAQRLLSLNNPTLSKFQRDCFMEKLMELGQVPGINR